MLTTIQFEVEDILYYFGRDKIAGPFLIIERRTGLCIETEMRAEQLWKPYLNSINGGINQQWMLKKIPKSPSEIVILSVINSMALDKTTDKANMAPIQLWRENDEAWQRWIIVSSPDKLGWIIQSAHDERVFDVGCEPKIGQAIWVYEKHERLHQQFLILPMGKVPK
jgi:hypothetical protein